MLMPTIEWTPVEGRCLSAEYIVIFWVVAGTS